MSALRTPRVRGERARGGRRSARVRAVLALSVVLLAAHGAARAANEPLIEFTYPAVDGTARSQDADVIFARYDRALNQAHSSFTLRDASNAPVPGTTFLSEPPGTIDGKRQINFRPDAPLSEANSPYTARAKVQAFVALGETVTQWQFWIDDTPPAAPVVTDPLDGDIRTDQPVVVLGTGEAAARVFVIEDLQVIAEDIVASTGDFSVTLPYPPEDGVSHTFEVFQQDPAGNISPGSGPITIWHDSIVHVPIIVQPPQGAFVNTTPVPVSGTAKPNTSVRIREGGPIIAVTAANAEGNWSVPIAFGEGTHTITAESFDGIFVDGPSPARTFTVDTIPPPAPVITAPAPGAFVPSSSVTIQGTAEALGTVEVKHQGIVRASTPVDGAGAWRTTLSFVEGAHTIEARAVDRAGNIGPAAFRSFTVDTVAPAAPVIETPAEGAFLNNANVTIGGAAEADADVEILVGTVAIGLTTANGAGVWSITLAFSDGAHSVVAVAIDAAGNRSPGSEPRGFTVDTVPPAAPVILHPPQNSTQTSSSVIVSGTAEPATTVEVWEGAVLLDTTDVDSEGNWSMELTFADGPHQIRARAIDLAFNIGPFSALRDFVVDEDLDVTPPPVPILVDPAHNSLQPGFVMFRGSAEQGSTVTIYEAGFPVASGAAPAGSFEFGAQMAAGPHQVVATATDPAGNESGPTAIRAFTVDDQRPTVTIDQGDGTLFVLQSPSFEGGAADNVGVAMVELEYRDLTGRLIETRTAGCGSCPGTPVTWSDAPTFLPGSYRLDASAVDTAGNRSMPASIRFYVV